MTSRRPLGFALLVLVSSAATVVAQEPEVRVDVAPNQGGVDAEPEAVDVATDVPDAAADDPASLEPRRSVVRDLRTSGGPARRPRDAGIDLSNSVDGENLAWWPWVASFSLSSIGIAVDTLAETPDPRWTGVGSFDLNIAEGILLNSATARSRAASASDVFLISSVLATYLDAALWRQTHRSTSRTSYRLIMLDSLVFSMNTTLVAIAKASFQRQRPAGRFCLEDPEFGGCQNRSLNRSFFSGHASTTFTAASLLCAHQRLRGQTPLGRIQCISSLALATSTSVLRMTAGKHYFSDVLVGAAVGFLLGYIFPVFIFPRRLPELPTERALRPDARAWW